MFVQVLPYSPDWPLHFDQIQQKLEEALKNVEYISIEHVGSTSVPGLPAKPVIDVDIVITAEKLQDTIEALTSKGGWKYIGECGIQDRHAFRQPSTSPENKGQEEEDALPLSQHNLYVCIENCQALRNHLLVRDLCRRDETVREEYGRVKMELGQREWMDVDEYCEAKSEVLGWVLRRAGMRMDEVGDIGELNTVKRGCGG